MAGIFTVQVQDIRLADSYVYEGIPLPLDCLRTTMEDLKTFEIRDSDVFIVTFPKAGTTWTQEMMSAVLHDGNLDELDKEHTSRRVPYLELTMGGNVYDEVKVPRIHKMLENYPPSRRRHIKSHLPGQLLPPQVWEKRVKMVYVARNPKDVIVSYYHHRSLFCPHLDLQFDDFFDAFMEGRNNYGKWWEHFLYYWERRNEDHVLFLTYEGMKKDPHGAVRQISEFLGKSFTDDVIDAITDRCSFQNMKSHPTSNMNTILKLRLGGSMGEKTFMRKGEVGGWKDTLSESQSEALDALCREKLAGTGLSFENA